MGTRPCEPYVRCPTLAYEQWCDCSGWQPADPDAFHCGDSKCTMTVVYAHGNRSNACDARRQGLEIYRQLRRRCPCWIGIRFVIWSWPSDAIPASYRILRDVRVKFRRTSTQSYVLAHWISLLPSDVPVTFVGYSFGARTILGALHLLGGGQLEGRCLPQAGCYPQCIKVVLWAAAAENTWLSARGSRNCALRVIDRALVTVNHRDPALKRFRRAICMARSRALGHSGLRGPLLCVSHHGCICELDVTRMVGRHHDWKRYACSSTIMSYTASVVCAGVCCP
jgi:hypothetical protein